MWQGTPTGWKPSHSVSIVATNFTQSTDQRPRIRGKALFTLFTSPQHKHRITLGGTVGHRTNASPTPPLAPPPWPVHMVLACQVTSTEAPPSHLHCEQPPHHGMGLHLSVGPHPPPSRRTAKNLHLGAWPTSGNSELSNPKRPAVRKQKEHQRFPVSHLNAARSVRIKQNREAKPDESDSYESANTLLTSPGLSLAWSTTLSHVQSASHDTAGSSGRVRG